MLTKCQLVQGRRAVDGCLAKVAMTGENVAALTIITKLLVLPVGDVGQVRTNLTLPSKGWWKGTSADQTLNADACF